MPASEIEQLTFQEFRFAGDTQPFFTGDAETLIESPWETLVDLPATPPITERVTVEITAISSEVVSNQVTYGGNYKPVIEDIDVSGDDLTDVQVSTIVSSLSVTPGAKNETDVFDFQITPIAAIGAQRFTVTVPYQEQEIDYPDNTIEIPFIRAYEGASPPSGDNWIAIANGIFAAKAGTVSEDIPVLSLENIVNPGERTVAELRAGKAGDLFTIRYAEDVVGRVVFSAAYSPPVEPFINEAGKRLGPYARYSVNVTPTATTVVHSLGFGIVLNPGGLEEFDTFESDAYLLSIKSGAGFELTAATGSTNRDFWRWTVNDDFPKYTRDAIAVTNNYSKNLIVEFRNVSDEITCRIQGEDSNGAFRVLDVVITDLTIDESVAEIIDQLPSRPGWANALSFSYDSVFGGCRSSTFENEVNCTFCSPEKVISAGTTVNFLVYMPTIPGASGLSVTFNYSDGIPTLEEIADVYNLFRDQHDLWLPMEPVYDINMPDSWKTSNLTPLALRGPSQTRFWDNQDSVETQGYWLGGNAYFNASFSPALGNTFTHSNYATIGELVTAFNNIYGSDSFFASSGLFYDFLPMSYYIPNTTIFEEFNSLFSSPADAIYRAVSGIDGRDDTPIANNTNYSVSDYATIDDFVAQINTDYSSIIDALVPTSGNGNASPTTINSQADQDFLNFGDSVTLFTTEVTNDVRTLTLSAFLTLEDFVDRLNSEWNAKDIFYEIHPDAIDRIDAVPTALLTTNGQISLNGTDSVDAAILLGEVNEVNPPVPPREDVSIEFNVRFADDGNPNSETGIQVALGGYTIDGINFFNSAPNTFFEPVFNTIFDIEFTTIEADTIWLLVRTRENVDGTVYSSDVDNYTATARYSNGFPTQTPGVFQTTDSAFVDVWGEDSLGGEMPVAIPVKGQSTRIDVDITETNILDSLNVTLFNIPSSLNEFAFLARNRTNDNQSMEESQTGRVFGLVLDNRGAWDVLIGPEATIREIADGEFDYLGRSYDREYLDTDEGYDFEFFNFDTLPVEVQNSISLNPVPGYPQVWALRIEPGVKSYLTAQRLIAPPNSLNGCSVDIDMFVTGRISDVEGICRVTIFHDYRCVFDTGLCDFFWNLTDPPEPEPPELIEDNLVFNYQTLIDCQRLDVDSDGSVNEFGAPVLINIQNVPTFENGNALLLIKSLYTPEIQGFYWPSRSDFAFIQSGNCDFISDNAGLIQRLNQQALYLPGQPDPITDGFQILSLISTEDSYLLVDPRFQFPVQDVNKDCSVDEVVVSGIGFQFKNWTNGVREEDILIGVNLVLGGDVFTAPEMQLCYRYYYDQEN